MLDDDAIERYARQIVIPGIGASGQERLLASTVLVAGTARGCAAAALWLRAAGVRVATSAETAIDVVAVVDAAALDPAMHGRLVGLGRAVCWSALDDAGIRSGVHPGAPLPAPVAGARESRDDALLDAAGCEAAALACRLLLGLAGANEARIHC